jgi:hypothetical protein
MSLLLPLPNLVEVTSLFAFKLWQLRKTCGNLASVLIYKRLCELYWLMGTGEIRMIRDDPCAYQNSNLLIAR